MTNLQRLENDTPPSIVSKSKRMDGIDLMFSFLMAQGSHLLQLPRAKMQSNRGTRNCHVQQMRSFFPSRGHKIGRGRNWEEAPAAALPQKRSSMTKGCPFCLPLESTKFALWLEQIDIAVIGTGPSRGCQHCCGAPHTLSRLWAAGSWCLMPRFCGVPARLGCWNNPCWPAETVEKMEKNWQRNYINSILQQSCNISKWM